MTEFIKSIQYIDLAQADEKNYKQCYVGCIVLTQDNKIMLQQRGTNWNHFPGYLSEFGGRIESDESPMQALIRELNEELGAQVSPADVISLGAVTEEATKHTELIYVYFWHDKHGTITGCYEGEAKYFDDIKTVFQHPKKMDTVSWLLNQCKKQKLLI